MHSFHDTNMRSHREIAIQKWLSSRGVKAMDKYKGLGFEIDLYLPSQKVGFEFNGLAWHFSACNRLTKHCKPKPHDYHFNKSMKALLNGVRLFHFWDFESTNEVKSQIEALLSGNKLSDNNVDKNPSLLADSSLVLEPRYVLMDKHGLYAVGTPLLAKPLCWPYMGVIVYEYYNSGYIK